MDTFSDRSARFLLIFAVNQLKLATTTKSDRSVAPDALLHPSAATRRKFEENIAPLVKNVDIVDRPWRENRRSVKRAQCNQSVSSQDSSHVEIADETASMLNAKKKNLSKREV